MEIIELRKRVRIYSIESEEDLKDTQLNTQNAVLNVDLFQNIFCKNNDTEKSFDNLDDT